MNNLNRSIERKFEHIARQNFWGSEETISGLGSTMDATVTVRNCIGDWIIKYGIKSIADIPCGECHWQHAIQGIDHVQYEGYDVSHFVLERAKRKNTNWTFRLLDVTQTVPPKADLVIMRDLLQHLPLEMGKQALDNVLRSASSYLGVTTYPETSVNTNIAIGEMYLNNVLKKPFNLENPIEICKNYSGKRLSVRPGSRFYLFKL